MRAAPDAYICGSYLPSSITRGFGGIGGFIRSSLGDFGHNGRGFLISTFAIFLPPRGRQWRMAPKAVRGSRSKPGPQERRPLDPQPLVRGGSPRTAAFGNTGGGDNVPEGRQPAFGNFAALGQTHKAKNGAKQIGEKEEVVTIPRMFKALHNSTPMGGSTTVRDSDTGATESAGDGDSTGIRCLASSDIYQTITSQHKQTQRDSKKARVATKQLQVVVSKVAKTCSEIGERIAAIECRADALESDLGVVTKQAAMHESQLSDIQWKVEDFENRQRRNNLRLIGIQEGVEGQDSRAFIIRLLKAAHPEQTGSDWEKEIQRAHRFPLRLRSQQLTGASGTAQQQPRAFIVYFGNYLLRQIVFEKARPDARISSEGCTFFSRPDFCHATVERRWHLRQLISPFQEKGAEAYLLSPARLKTIYNGMIRVFASEIKAKEYLQSLT
ncbi:hypothetical protein NDU88_000511 [Pleurodeles waltl]|uniref:Uncharacterized protein n=1 Tax=Pleurodeles waltl TaxID=8319 RepID=A0AAV7UQ74_PLEWA|nr:hypothetical protein NDU88_000511 [Pleurodeles waltl]